MLEHMLGISKPVVQLRARWRRLHRRRKQGQTVETIEYTALDLCATTMTQQEVVNPRWIAFKCGHWSWRNCVADERGLRM